MYLDFWGMKSRPFDNSHSPKNFVPIESSMLALTKLRYSVAMGLGVACISGEAGCGKTELIKIALLDFMKSGWAGIYLSNPSGDRNDLFKYILHKLEGKSSESQSPFETLEGRLKEIGSGGGKVLIAIDDAQSISDVALLDDLRMLLNIENDGMPVLNFIVAGQRGVYSKLAAASGFDSKVAMKINLLSYDDKETETYILSRLKNSGCTRGIFTKRAAEMIFAASGGLPGAINRLCELALITAFASGTTSVKPAVIRTAAKELGLRGDAGANRILDEVWSEETAPLEKFAEPQIDILAELASN